MNDFLFRMKSLLGDEYDEFLKFYEAENFRGLRVNTLKCSVEKLKNLLDFELNNTPFCGEGFYIPDNVSSLGNNPLHHAGAFYIQEPSATSAVTMLDVNEGDYVLDLCAAPGGKSTQIGAKLNGTGLLWSNEIVKNRANILLSNIERMGIKMQLFQIVALMYCAQICLIVLIRCLLMLRAAARECSARIPMHRCSGVRNTLKAVLSVSF